MLSIYLQYLEFLQSPFNIVFCFFKFNLFYVIKKGKLFQISSVRSC